MFLSLANMLSWWEWLILAALPPAIVLLYFLKLRRQPLEVPSTFLWHKSIEDLHVNSLWQRLRRNLLLLLQLLVILLAILALLRPGWRSEELAGDRFVILIDNSASMQATDVEPSRLEEAKRRAAELIEEMDSGSTAMIISFADKARTVQTFTQNRQELLRSLDSIQPTQRRTSLEDALRAAAGLANPARAGDTSEYVVAEPLPATLVIYSDGKFPDVTGFSLGNLEPVYVPIGREREPNVAVTTFSVRRHELNPGLMQAYGEVENFGPEAVEVALRLYLDGREINVDRQQIPAGARRGVKYDLDAIDSGIVELRLFQPQSSPSGEPLPLGDSLPLDDRAWVAVNPPRPAEVLLVTTGNEPLERALTTRAAARLADLTIEPPEFLASDVYRQQAAIGAWDLIIYDRCRPEKIPESQEPTMPRSNTWFIGTVPPGDEWSAGGKTDRPAEIIDVDAAHPLMALVNMDDVWFVEGRPLTPPEGHDVLVDTLAGPMLVIAPRETYRDLVSGVELVTGDGDMVGTNWQVRLSFPLFIDNVLSELAAAGRSELGDAVQPGATLTLAGFPPGGEREVQTPSGDRLPVRSDGATRASFTGTEELGIYRVLHDGDLLERFAVNLFDQRESDLRPRPEGGFKIGYYEVPPEQSWEPTRRELWKWLLMVGLSVVALEWYVYCRRVRP